MKRKKERVKGAGVTSGPLQEPLPIGTIFDHTIGVMQFKVKVTESERCQGCVALEGIKSECHKLYAKAGHCFSTDRPDGKEVSFQILKQRQGKTYTRVKDEEDSDED